MLNKKKNSNKTSSYTSTDKLNQIVEGSAFEGNFTSNSNLRVDGKVVGNINITGKLVLGLNGHIEGEIICENAEIEGSFTGDIRVNSFLCLKETAVIDGDIFTQKISVEPGAVFTGKCAMSKGGYTSNPQAAHLAGEAVAV